MKKIVAISGSLRKNSHNSALLRAAKNYVSNQFEFEILSIKDIPLFNEDDERLTGIPNNVSVLKEKIVHSNGLLIATPEYNHGIPGVLKNTLDWLTRPTTDVGRVFKQKKVGLIGASPSRLGTAFAQTAWLPILRYLNTHTYFGNQLFISSAYTVFDESGNLIDQKTVELIKEYMKNFCSFIESN